LDYRSFWLGQLRLGATCFVIGKSPM